MSIRVVLVDDHRLVRSGVRAELEPDLEVVGEADDVDCAVEVVTRQLPDVEKHDVGQLTGGDGGGGAEVLRR